MLFKEVISCHICSTEFKYRKEESPPSICSACGADMENRSSELLYATMECEHLKGALGIAPGELCITDKRIFWIARKDASGNVLVDAITRKNANIVPVNIPLGGIERIGDYKNLIRKGITIFAKNGESYNFNLVNRGNPQKLKDFLAPYVGNIFDNY